MILDATEETLTGISTRIFTKEYILEEINYQEIEDYFKSFGYEVKLFEKAKATMYTFPGYYIGISWNISAKFRKCDAGVFD